MKIALTKFKGIAPKIRPFALAANMAQDILNCRLDSGGLKPILQDTTIQAVPSGTKTLYRFGADTISDTNYWFTFPFDANVCRGQIHDDSTERTYYTGGSYPRVTNYSLALTGGSPYPVNSYQLGLPSPVDAATLGAIGSADSSGLTETRVYIYTYVSAWGEESPPSPPATILWNSGQSISISGLDVAPAGNYNVATKRIYRSSGQEYAQVAEIPVATTTYSDTVLSTALTIACQSLLWEPPPTGLLGLTNMPNGMMAGFVGRDVYFCVPYVPYAWPISYVQTVDFPIVGMAMAGNSLIVLTTGYPFLFSGADPSSVTFMPITFPQACVSKRSIVSMGNAVWYASPDGLCAIDNQGNPLNLTEQVFIRVQWQAYNPSSISAWRWEEKYVAFYDNGTQAGFMMDLDEQLNAFVPLDFYATAGYNDLIDDQLFLAIGANIVKFQGSTTPRSMSWKSKVFRSPTPKSLAACQVHAAAYPVHVQVYADGALASDVQVQSHEPYRFPDGFMEMDWEVVISGTNIVDSVTMASSIKELKDG